MADTPQKRKFRKSDWKRAAEFIHQEWQRRKESKIRKDAERIWKEVDRQIAMQPRIREVNSGQDDDWLPNIELPLQATALEVLTADARRLKFPTTTDWYLAHAELSDKYSQRFSTRRDTVPLIGDEPTGMKLDQETGDVFVKATIDHFHQLYNFRAQISMLDSEAFKYGTYAARVHQALLPKFTSDFRGIRKERVLGPVVVPVSIKNLYLDDSPQNTLQEGVAVAPAQIREYFQRLDDLLRAAKTGGVNKGWITTNLKNIEPMGGQDEKKGHVQLLEWEGDLILPRKNGKIFLPNVIITVAVGNNGPSVVRFRENKFQFRSYVTGTYQRDDINSPYGTSPLMKGQPIQEAASEALNRTLAAGALNAQPPVIWDAQDTQLAGTGGPSIYPGAKWSADDPNSIRVENLGNPGELFQMYLGLVNQYEELTGVSAPRRGAQTKSHTTAFAVDVENSRGLVRTEDFVNDQEQGPLTSMLYMEWEIIKKSLTSTTAIYVGQSGIDGFVNLHKDDLPDNVVFEVIGSRGPATKREKQQAVTQGFQMAAQMSQLSAQFGGPVFNFGEAMKEILEDAGVQNPERFITSPQGVPGQSDGIGGVQGAAGVLPEEQGGAA